MDTQSIGLLIGLLALALACFLGISGFRDKVINELSAIKNAITAIQTTTDKVWDLLVARSERATVERNLENLGKVSISAEPGRNKTTYHIKIEKPIIWGELISKLSKETGFVDKEIKILGKEPIILALSKTHLVMHVSCSESKVCTEYISLFLKWLNSTYVESLEKEIKKFEEPILS